MARMVDFPMTAQQREFVYYVLENDDAEQIAFGGARGGNKTFSGAAAMVLRRLRYPGTRGLALRKTERASVENIRDQVRKVCRMLGVKVTWLGGNLNKFLLPSGSTIDLASCRNQESYEKYIGLEYTDIWWEEAVQHTREAISLVNGSARTDFPGCLPKIWYTTNPGGPGHRFLYEDFVDPRTRKPRCYWVRSTLTEALPTLVNDPGYLDRITRGLSAIKRKQWIDGDWLAMAGVYFSIGEEKTLREIEVPYWAEWFGGVDYGQAAPFCVLWAAKWQDAEGVDHIHFVREIYQKGLHLDQQSREALGMEQELYRQYRINRDLIYYGDRTITNLKPSESVDADFTIQQVWKRNGWYVYPSEYKVRAPGWHLMRQMMYDGVMTISPTGCPAFVMELRNAVYDNPDSPSSEDISQDCQDHALTACSYLLRKIFKTGYNAVAINAYGNPKSRDEEPERIAALLRQG